MSSVYKIQYLKGRRLKVMMAIADRILPPDEDSPGGGTMQTMGIIDWGLGRISDTLRSQLLLLIMVVEVLGIFYGGLPFTMNSDAAQDRQLRFMERGPIRLFRMGFFGLKSYVCMGYYTREDIWKTIDYDGPIFADREFPDHIIRDLCQGRAEVEA